jgi:tRNA pseudouridine13 synthase
VGVPNYFGIQRFGVRGDTWRIGRAVVLGRTDEAVDLILGRPADEDVGDILEARRLYDAGDYARAARTWPGIFHEERRALKALVRSGGVRKVAFRGIDRRTRELYVSAYQSYLFNCAVAARLSDGLGRLHRGDLAWRHANGAVFRVEDPVAEQPRADHFEISPTGPLFGRRMTAPEGWPAEVEAGVLATESLDPATLSEGAFRLLGGRRPLRFRPENISASLGADERGSYFELCFALDRGCYATALLRELFAPAPGGALAMDG